MLETLWDQTNMTLFFESGEAETAVEFKLPFKETDDVKKWLLEYLKKLPQAKVEAIGQFKAGDYGHYANKGNKRTLFKVTRK